MKRGSARGPERASQGRAPAASAMLFAALLLLLIVLPASAAYDFTGRVERISEPNIMWVNVTQEGTYGLQAVVEVLLKTPLEGLDYFRGRDLQFEILGHDIMGRPVCEAYLEETNIREAYYCLANPVECCYREKGPDLPPGQAYRCEWAEHSPCSRRGNCSPYRNCCPYGDYCPQGYYCSYDYPWLSFV